MAPLDIKTAGERISSRIVAEIRRGLIAAPDENCIRCAVAGYLAGAYTQPTARQRDFEDLVRQTLTNFGVASVDIGPSPATVDWSSAAEATAALDAGILPPGCSLAADGALVIPDSGIQQGRRGTSVVLQHRFAKIVTASGRVLKSRDDASPALKAARAL